ncbi:MAG: 3-hydroxyacyl-CoA dehydrogenase family protein [Anaerolineae bacterium]|nr:3-hydroxyacyl-CoA dehydrogenase family protein [Anaerolineae bacterium]
MSNPERITVVGAGLMGHGIAQIFAAHGHPVWLHDAYPGTLNSAKDRVRANLTNMAEHGVILDAGIDEIVDRIRTTGDLATACAEAEFVFEAVYENLELKQQIFADLDRLCTVETILCSNTSVISITEIAEKAQHRQRIVGTHFWNPPYLIPLVEVVRAADSADECLQATYELLARVGKHPVYVQKDVPGFVGNRLQHALWREAFAIIDEGICDPATVDEVIRNGFGLRLPILGPVETADMIGLDLSLAIHDYILKHLNADPTPSTTLQAKVEAGELGFKTGSGFLEWTEEEMAASRQRLASYLMRSYAEQQEPGA